MMSNEIGDKSAIYPSILAKTGNVQPLLKPNLLHSKCLMDLIHQSQVQFWRINMTPPSLRLLPPRNSKRYHLQLIHYSSAFPRLPCWQCLDNHLSLDNKDKQPKIPLVDRVMLIVMVLTIPKTRSSLV